MAGSTKTARDAKPGKGQAARSSKSAKDAKETGKPKPGSRTVVLADTEVQTKPDELVALWTEFKGTASPEARERLILHYAKSDRSHVVREPRS